MSEQRRRPVAVFLSVTRDHDASQLAKAMQVEFERYDQLLAKLQKQIDELVAGNGFLAARLAKRQLPEEPSITTIISLADEKGEARA